MSEPQFIETLDIGDEFYFHGFIGPTGVYESIVHKELFLKGFYRIIDIGQKGVLTEWIEDGGKHLFLGNSYKGVRTGNVFDNVIKRLASL